MRVILKYLRTNCCYLYATAAGASAAGAGGAAATGGGAAAAAGVLGSGMVVAIPSPRELSRLSSRSVGSGIFCYTKQGVHSFVS